MGLTRKDLERSGKWLEMSEEEWLASDERRSRQEWIDRTQANDEWAVKASKSVGILLTSHQANRPYLRASVESHAKLGLWITLAYDSFVNPEWEQKDIFDAPFQKYMPGKETMEKVDLFMMPHYQTWGGPMYPYFWLLKWGVNAMRNFEYIYCANGDFIVEKPEGFHKLLSFMDDVDIMTSGPDRDDPPAANTAGFIVRTEAMVQIVKHLEDHLVPWSNYERYTQLVGNMEGRFGWAIKELGLRQFRVEPPLEDMFRVPGHGTWANVLGFRHLHSEHNYAYRNRAIPPHHSLLDPRFMGDEYNVIKAYHETGDKSVLETWWAKED